MAVRITLNVNDEELGFDEVASGRPVISLGKQGYSDLISQLNGANANADPDIAHDCPELIVRAAYQASPKTRSVPAVYWAILLVVAAVAVSLLFLGAWKTSELLRDGAEIEYRDAPTPRERYSGNLQRMLAAMRVLDFRDSAEQVQLQKEAESDLIHCVDEMNAIVGALDQRGSDYAVLWNVVEGLEEQLENNPLKYKDTAALLTKISELKLRKRR